LSVRERVGRVKAIVLSDTSKVGYQTSPWIWRRFPEEEMMACTHPLLVTHVVVGIVLKVEGGPVPFVNGTTVFSDLYETTWREQDLDKRLFLISY